MNSYLAFARFVQFTSLVSAFGLALFCLYAPAGVLPVKRLRAWLMASSLAALLSAFLWWDATAVGMSGAWSGASDPRVLTAVLSTAFGTIWLIRLPAAIFLPLLLLPRGALSSALSRWAVFLCAGFLTLTLGFSGHAVMLNGAAGFVLVSVQAIHALAAGAWLGGLLLLAMVLSAHHVSAPHAVVLTVRRFSTMGLIAVGLLVLTGIAGTQLIVTNLSTLFTSSYGDVLGVKIALFLAMLGFAAINNRRHTPRLDADLSIGRAIRILRRNALLETVLGAGVMAAVAVLGTLSPHGEDMADMPAMTAPQPAAPKDNGAMPGMAMPNPGENGDTGTDGMPGIAAEADRIVRIEARDISFDMKSIQVRAGETVRFVIANSGKLRHEFVIASHAEHLEHRAMMQKMPGMDMSSEPNAVTVDPGETKDLVWKFGRDTDVEFACDIPGHAEAGMAGRFVVGR